MGIRLKIKTATGTELLTESLAGPQNSATVFFSPAGTRGTIAANVNYAVPAYVVGSGRLQIWLDGILCTQGTNAAQHQYKEIGAADSTSTNIQWHQAIDTSYDILTRIR